ncbi:hypothetical protein KSC_014140 [Ktedonobacter sp. SOSP1-52]|uniref:phage portal protein n=1 Tax=Ktedonobacter sp. SOSP1-52 TaxID=2778366 RepID=UPI001916966E|nr:phage portal protein [Ktedonobacter sp. SOSP1-52]GHO62522.1 hypothetical protein KSC_014140 [Ktedonobacter sp. SOSP1-52]
MEQKQQISWFGRIRQAVSGGVRGARISEQMNPGFFSSTAGVEEERRWGYASGTEEDYYWRRLSDNFYLKDLVPSAYLEMHNQVYEAYHANPLAFAIIEMTTSFVLGRGVKLDASNKRVKKVLDEFWQANSMDERVYTICNELALYGEIFVRYFVNRFDGSVKVRLTDPSLIDQIETDPEDIETPLRFHRRPVGESASAPSSTTGGLKLIFRPGERETEGEWFEADSQMQQFAINKVSNAKRGNSDLATMLPWLRRYKDWLTDRVRINKYKGAFIWDVTLRGADRKTIDTKRMEYSTPPQPGSVLLHNEAESWQAVQPAINANDAKEDGRALKLMIAVGAGLPEHYLADSSNGNRATAAEMGMPTLLKFQRRQRYMKYILRCILDRVLAEAQGAGRLGENVNLSYDLIFPEIDLDDNKQLAGAANALTQALTAAKAQGWLSDETAMRLLFKFAGEDISVHDELARIRGEQASCQAPPPQDA